MREEAVAAAAPLCHLGREPRETNPRRLWGPSHSLPPAPPSGFGSSRTHKLAYWGAIATARKVLSCPARTYTLAGSVKFIDYEYAGYNYQAFDIGNHFNEFAGLNEVDYSYYPERSIQLLWLRSYLEAYKELKGQGSAVTDTEVENLYIQVNQFALASHFFWGLWALIQAKFSTINFDFLRYAILRFNQYFKMKPEAAALSLPK